jgi:catalase
MDAGVTPEVVSKFKGTLKGEGGEVKVDKSHVTTASIMYDAVFVPGGQKSIETQKMQGDALHFVQEAFKHCKAVGAMGAGVELLRAARLEGVRLSDDDAVMADAGVVTAGPGASGDAFAQAFIGALAAYRHFERERRDEVPA